MSIESQIAQAAAQQAAASATTAANAAEEALVQAQGAAEEGAAIAIAGAAISASDAATSASQAATSQVAAAGFEAAAATSASSALTSQTSAANSASNAATLEAGVTASRNAAAVSETNALASKNAAGASAGNASASQVSAGESAAAAVVSKNDAASSATDALASKNAAAGFSTDAFASKNAASTSETNALASKNAAATSETNAATSATNAGTSATNAAGSATAAEASLNSTWRMNSTSTPVLIRNLISNPSFETTVLANAAATGAQTITRVSTESWTGGWSAESRSDAGTTSTMRQIYQALGESVGAGRTVTMAVRIKTNFAWAGTVNVRFRDVVAGINYALLPAALSVADAAGWRTVTITHTVPVGSTLSALYVVVQGATFTDTNLVWFDGWQLTETPDLVNYFDGASPGCYWSGTAHASISHKALYGPNDVVRSEKTPELSKNWFTDPFFSTSKSGFNDAAGVGNGVLDSTRARSGTQSLKLTQTATGGVSPVVSVTILNTHPLVVTGKVITFSAWFYVPSGNATGGTANTLRIGGNVSPASNSTSVTVFDTWVRRSYTTTVSNTGGSIVLYLYSGTQNQSIWVDDVALTEGADLTVTESFDGNTPGARWIGTPYASESVKYLPSRTDMDAILWADAGRMGGIGSPEGAIAARVGARYIDTAATNGAIEWVKVTGTGTTGWKVAHGDTGRRNLASLFNAGFTLSEVEWVQRVGDTVSMRLNVTATANGAAFTLPLGFRPSGTFDFLGYTARWNTTLAPSGNVQVSASSGIVTWNGGTTVNTGGYWSWITTDAWPTTLPGTAA